jgi:hypothetical protein
MADSRLAPTPSAVPAPKRVTWRSPRSRPPPAGFIHPARPTLVAYPPTGPGWWHEVKHDGFRILARKQGDRVDDGAAMARSSPTGFRISRRRYTACLLGAS